MQVCMHGTMAVRYQFFKTMAPEQQTPVPSPCINVCEMAPDTGLCRGCLRTMDEIVAWGAASDEDKRVIWARIRQREAALF